MSGKPEILAPAGDLQCALAAFAAGADAVYLGLKHFSARMQAENFSMRELSQLTELAHTEGRKVFVALNTLLKPGDPASAGKLMAKLERDVHPDAFIMQDPGALLMARQVGFSGELYLSTLANITHPAAFKAAQSLGADRVILPRELNLDELRACCQACPEGMGLEIFVHGALCYCVSGRCYWSSYMGGKSGLRGRCVQPCRRVYKQRGRSGRFFSCQDLSLDVLTKVLMTMPELVSWKIEGRKKGPHYVYHVTGAYRLLADHPGDAEAKKEAEELLVMALSRSRTKSIILPQRPYAPTEPGQETGSGLFAGKVTQHPGPKPGFSLKPRFALMPGDLLRVGYEDEPWHFTSKVNKPVKKGGSHPLHVPPKKKPRPGTAVFLIDRKSPELSAILDEWQKALEACPAADQEAVDFTPDLPRPAYRPRPMTITLARTLPQGKGGALRGDMAGLWLGPRSLKAVPKGLAPRISWWLPPVIWPNEEEQWAKLIGQTLRKGGKQFVLGAPWQAEFFKEHETELIAGPFCNPSNPAELTVYMEMGIKGAIISPELSGKDMLSLPKRSPMPLGVVLYGYWPMGLSRLPLTGVNPGEAFASPKGEVFWARKQGQNTWIFPGWPLDIRQQKDKLMDAGYSLFVLMRDEPPKAVPKPKRTSQFNYELTLL
jgi:putative protease